MAFISYLASYFFGGIALFGVLHYWLRLKLPYAQVAWGILIISTVAMGLALWLSGAIAGATRTDITTLRSAIFLIIGGAVIGLILGAL